ncbi:MAG: hypothetical protein EOO51_02405 [Flavobacterium sp.]|nr:MAG: hypothetical protein EOO51_02405 [Flavobacterium sp.]
MIYIGNAFGGKLLCTFFGHKFRTTRIVTNYFRESECTVCGLQVTNDDNGKLISLTPEQREINHELVNMHNKRKPRKKVD